MPEIEKPDTATDLALERTELAVERTHLAWIRTMFAIITSGIAIDKGLEIIHQQRLLKNDDLAEGGHVVGLFLTGVGTILLFTKTTHFVRRGKKLASLKQERFHFFTSTFVLAIVVFLTGLAMMYLMLTTG